MELIAALEIANEIATIANQWMTKANTAGAIVKKVQAEGRTTLTDAEYKQLTDIDDVERTKLDEAIRVAKAEGR